VRGDDERERAADDQAEDEDRDHASRVATAPDGLTEFLQVMLR
jgi:hypothetical protein